jgi:endonuclease/exonuclease/phosphatase family metal-dependent hydrolase
LKIIQLNIWGGKLGHRIIDFLQAESPDIVCMQEVNDLKGRSGYNLFASLDEIKEGASFDHDFMSPTYSYRYMERELSYGNAILSKFPISSRKTIFTHGAYKQNFDITQDDGNVRNLQVATVDTAAGALNIVNHHGYHIHGSKAGTPETLKAMQLIADTISKLDGPVIVCGDFNLAPDSQSLAILNDQLTNLSITNNLTRTYSQLSIVNEVCDYIFVNDQVKVHDFQMSEELVSDHQALILEFDV